MSSETCCPQLQQRPAKHLPDHLLQIFQGAEVVGSNEQLLTPLLHFVIPLWQLDLAPMLSFMLWGYFFCPEVTIVVVSRFLFAVRLFFFTVTLLVLLRDFFCLQEIILFAMRLLLFPWGFSFFSWVFFFLLWAFSFTFAVRLFLLLWQLWATILHWLELVLPSGFLGFYTKFFSEAWVVSLIACEHWAIAHISAQCSNRGFAFDSCWSRNEFRHSDWFFLCYNFAIQTISS